MSVEELAANIRRMLADPRLRVVIEQDGYYVFSTR